MDDYNNLYEFRIPDNILQAKRYFGFPRRNIIEAGISALIFGGIIYLIPFVTRVKIIFLVTICGSSIILNLIGVRDQSLSELFINFVNSQKNRGKYHLRSIDNEPEKQRDTGTEAANISTVYGESAADKTLGQAKKIFKQIKEWRLER